MSDMKKSKVYFTDFRCGMDEGPADKLRRLLKAAGMDKLDLDGKFVAIKMHFGELGNMSYLRPNYAKAVADLVKECGGKPFLTDCNTLYPGSRKNAIEPWDVRSSSATGSRARMTSPYRWRAANISKRQRSGMRSWTRMCLFP